MPCRASLRAISSAGLRPAGRHGVVARAELGQRIAFLSTIVEYFISDDEDDNTCKIDDYKEGREEETITVLGIVDGVKQGRIERREDRDNYVRFIKGVFIERIDDKLDFAACA